MTAMTVEETKTRTFKPNLAAEFIESMQRYPAFASPKLDGVRSFAVRGNPMSRSMKIHPNKALQAWMKRYDMALDGMDGELIVGEPNAPDVFRTTTSVIASHDKPIDGMRFFVFDLMNKSVDVGYASRLSELAERINKFSSELAERVVLVKQQRINSASELAEYEGAMLEEGYEGVMLRSLNGLYKQGRSTVKEGGLIKVKRFEDAEAEIVGTEEEMHNTNEAERNELGRTKRSSLAAGLVGKGTMGALVVKGLNGPFADVTFNIGTGFTAADRAADWPIGSVVTYKYFNIGTKDKPRHPVFKGRRDRRDFDALASKAIKKMDLVAAEHEDFGVYS